MSLFNGYVDFTVHSAIDAQISIRRAELTPVSGVSVGETQTSTSHTPYYIGGVLVIFLLASCIVGDICYRRHRTQKAIARLQQIVTLERIWKMTYHR